MPFQISQSGYGGNDNLAALIGGDFAKYKTTNPYGLENYTPEGFGDVNIGGGQYNVRWDDATQKYSVGSLADPHLGSYQYGADGKLENWAPYNPGNDWGNAAMALGAGLTMGFGGAALGGSAGAGEGVGSAGGFVGEGALSGVPAWDAAGSTLGTTGAMGAGGAGLSSAGGGAAAQASAPAFNAAADSQLANAAIGPDALSGYTGAGSSLGLPTANPAGGFLDSLAGKVGNMGSMDWLKLGGTALGALGGSQGVQGTNSTASRMDPRLDGPVYGQLVPAAQGLLANQMPQVMQAGQGMVNAGTGLLSQPIAGNGVGKVTLNSPTTSTNPHLGGMADDIARRTMQSLGQNNLSIQGNSVASGGLGGARQGVAQGLAAGNAMDSLQGNLSNLYGQQYSADQNRALQQYGMDQSFYSGQRGQDIQGAGLGADLTNAGFGLQWQPIKAAGSVYAPFTNTNTTTTNSSSQGGGAMGALGGALGAAQVGKNMGWW